MVCTRGLPSLFVYVNLDFFTRTVPPTRDQLSFYRSLESRLHTSSPFPPDPPPLSRGTVWGHLPPFSNFRELSFTARSVSVPGNTSPLFSIGRLHSIDDITLLSLPIRPFPVGLSDTTIIGLPF